MPFYLLVQLVLVNLCSLAVGNSDPYISKTYYKNELHFGHKSLSNFHRLCFNKWTKFYAIYDIVSYERLCYLIRSFDNFNAFIKLSYIVCQTSAQNHGKLPCHMHVTVLWKSWEQVSKPL